MLWRNTFEARIFSLEILLLQVKNQGQEKKAELQGSKPQRIIFSTETLITRIPSAGHKCLGFGVVNKAEIRTYDSHLE